MSKLPSTDSKTSSAAEEAAVPAGDAPIGADESKREEDSPASEGAGDETGGVPDSEDASAEIPSTESAPETDAAKADATENADDPSPDDEEPQAGEEKPKESATIDSSTFSEEPDEEDDDEDEEDKDRPMTLRDHLTELRKRLCYIFLFILVGFCVCWAWAEPMFHIMMEPLYQALPAARQELNFTHPTEAFFCYMKVAFVAGLFLTSPLIFWQIWSFVAPGLHKEEKIYLLPLSFFSALFFLAGAAFCYYVSLPFVFDFLMSYNSEHIRSMLKMEDSLSFVLQLVVAFGFIFEMPLFVFFLARMGIITAAWMRKVRRYAILTSVIVAAILTPPDVMSQLLMAGPLLILYELSILVAVVFGKKSPQEEPETSPSLPVQGA